jgi:hypothetical protein
VPRRASSLTLENNTRYRALAIDSQRASVRKVLQPELLIENGPVVPPVGKVDDPVVSIESGPVVHPAGLVESLFLYRE